MQRHWMKAISEKMCCGTEYGHDEPFCSLFVVQIYGLKSCCRAVRVFVPVAVRYLHNQILSLALILIDVLISESTYCPFLSNGVQIGVGGID